MFWRSLPSLIETFRAELMAELERSPQMVRQGAAAVACLAAASAALPVIAERAAEQRSDALWNARALAFQADLAQARLGGIAHAPEARLRLKTRAISAGYAANAQADLPTNFEEGRAIRVSPTLSRSNVLAGLKPFQPVLLRHASDVTKAQRCLAEAIYYEARGESFRGQMAVAEVVVNRVRSSVYSDDLCRVVYQGSHLSTGCQFTFTCDGSLGRTPRGPAWERAKMLAAQVLMGFARPMTQRATHYHTTDITPYWSASLVETTRVGSHVFYRFPSRQERAQRAQAIEASGIALGGDDSGQEAALLVPAAADEALALAPAADAERLS